MIMKKIMFNDKFGLTQAVLEGRKTMTRRVFYIPDKLALKYYFETDNLVICETQHNGDVIEWRDSNENVRITFEPKYKIGEVIAIAQSYKNIDNYYNAALYRKTSIHGQIVDELDLVSFQDIRRWKYFSGDLMNTSGWTNKMFVKADLMPHHIKITGIKVERLRDISDEDCLKEGIIHVSTFLGQKIYHTPHVNGSYLSTNVAQEAFATLIDKVSGKGTWESNPFVFAYEFVLVD